MIDIECNYADLYDMSDRASLLTSDKDKNTIKLVLKNRELIISSNSPEIGKVEEKIAIVLKQQLIPQLKAGKLVNAKKVIETYISKYNFIKESNIPENKLKRV